MHAGRSHLLTGAKDARSLSTYEVLQAGAGCITVLIGCTYGQLDSALVSRVACLVTKHDATGNPTSCLGLSKPNL